MRNYFPYHIYVIFDIFVILSSAIFSVGIKFEKITISPHISRIVSFGSSRSVHNSQKTADVPAIGSKDIHFVLYNRMVPEGKFIDNPEELLEFNFDDHELFKFLAHGWLSSGHKETCQSIKDAYLNLDDVNIFVVHWEKIASSYFYLLILDKMGNVADNYAQFLMKFIEIKKVDPGKVHLIGHSLGAHISGMVGKRVRENGITVGRITGLDPAFPGFHASSNLEKLSQSDAHFVDIIHTASGTLGMPGPIGHVDFYPNGGVAPMPGCEKFMVIHKCSHSRSWQYFAESIIYPFFATKCEKMEDFQNGNCTEIFTQMGEHTSKDARGTYFLTTNCEYPYSLGIDGRNLLSVCENKHS